MSKKSQSKDIKKNLYQELSRVVDKIRINYRPEKIILFGSLAIGVPSQTSDIDLAIIKKTKKRFLDRNLEVALIADPLEAFDFLVYTPKEWQEMQKKIIILFKRLIGVKFCMKKDEELTGRWLDFAYSDLKAIEPLIKEKLYQFGLFSCSTMC